MPQRRMRHRRIVGVMIDGDVLRGVELRRGLRGLRARAAAEVVLPESIGETDGPIDRAATAAALKTLWKQGRFRTKRVAFGIGGGDATIRPMNIPSMPGSEVAGFARYELGEYLSYDLAEAIVDHTLVKETENEEGSTGATSVIAVGVRISLVEDVAAAVSEAGLRIESIDAAPTALAAAITPMSSAGESEALVSVAGTRTTVVLRTGGRPRMVRVLAEGGGDRTTQLADELESLIASVDQHRHGGDHLAASDGQARRFTEAAEAVTAAIRYDIREHTGSGVDRVVLTGTFSQYQLLHQLMAEASGVEVVAAPAPSWWNSELEFDHYVEPTGLAVAALGDANDRFNLLAPSVITRRRHRRERAVGMVAGIALLTAAFPLMEQQRSNSRQLEQQASGLESAGARLRARTSEMVPIGDLDAALDRESAALGDALQDDLWWARILEEIANATPDATFLTSMSLVRPVGTETRDDFVASFTGVGPDQASIGSWLAAMAQLEVLDDVWLVQSTASIYGEDATPVVTFLAEATLTTAARTRRAVEGSDYLLASPGEAEGEASP